MVYRLSWLPASREKYPALTGVRALGAMAVYFQHFHLTPATPVVINPLGFFYVLSGLLIVRVYQERAELTLGWLSKYFVNRFARIYPIYFLLLCVAVYLHHETRPWVLLANFTMTHALFHQLEIIIQPTWSLTVEECFYALAPLFMLLARRRSFWVAFAAGWVMLLVALYISTLGIVFLETRQFVMSYTFFGHFVEFFAGFYVALALIKAERQGSFESRGVTCTLVGLVAVIILLIAMVAVYRRTGFTHQQTTIALLNNFLIPAPIGLLYWGLIRERTVLSRLLSSKLFGLLGRSSYAFYVLHVLVVDYVGVRVLAAWPGYRWEVVTGTFIATWLIAIALFVLYEEPLNGYIRRQAGAQSPMVGMRATLFR